MEHQVIALTGLLVGLSAFPAAGDSYDLVADFSDQANPNGPWSYREGYNALPFEPAWDAGRDQGAWARAKVGEVGHIPAVARMVYSEADWKKGDVLVHSWDPGNGGNNSFANIAWTAPSTGTIDIAGSTWLARNIGRAVDVSLWLGDEALDSVSLFDGDSFDRAAPAAFEGDLSGRRVAAGDEVMIRVDYQPPFGDLAGLRLHIDFTPDCEADLDGNGVLDLFDFLAYVNLFNSGNPAADCDGAGGLTLFDFLCYVNLFNAGC